MVFEPRTCNWWLGFHHISSPSPFPATESVTGAEARLAHSLGEDTDIRDCELLGMSLVSAHTVHVSSTFLNSTSDPRLICMCTPVDLSSINRILFSLLWNISKTFLTSPGNRRSVVLLNACETLFDISYSIFKCLLGLYLAR
jgi:hypothetical protein